MLSEAQVNTTAGQLIQQRLSTIRCMEVLREGVSNGDFGEEFPNIRYEEEIRAVTTIPNLFRVKLHLIRGPDPGSSVSNVEALLYKPEKIGASP